MRNKMVKSSVVALVGVMFVLFFVSNAPAPGVPTWSLTKTCTPASAEGQPITFSATLTNTGNQNIIDITCEDVPYVELIGVPGTLGFGQSATITGSYTPAAYPSTDTITCSGKGEITSNTITATASATCGYLEDDGCTLTPGYWKTHSSYGPSRYDEVWATIGEDTIFYLSGQTYHDVLWTAPKGNGYYILSFQFIAAMLNVNKGASVPSNVQDALSDAIELFGLYAPSQVTDSTLRARFVRLANILNNYNEGILGPGHCR